MARVFGKQYELHHTLRAIMLNQAHRVLILTAISAIVVPAWANDCAPAAKSAIWNSGNTPVSTTSIKTDSQGKKSTTRTIQTITNKYVQTANGKWYSMNISIKDLIDDRSTTKVTCRRSGSDTVNGEQAATYEVQLSTDDVMDDSKIWVSSKNLIMKSEGSIEGARYTTVYDYAHVVPPADAARMGGN
jgi:hypothetical protein